MNLYLKYAVVVSVSFLISLALTLLVRQTNITRFMFGMKSKPKARTTSAKTLGEAAVAA
jgi:hypothetical protein